MKILIHTNGLQRRYGTQIQLVDLATAYAEAGHTVMMCYYGKNIFKDLLDAFGIQYQGLEATPDYYNPWSFTAAARKLQTVCQTFKPDVIHSNLEIADVVGQQVMHKTGIPHVITFRSEHHWQLSPFSQRPRWHPANIGALWRINYRRWWLKRGQPRYVSNSQSSGFLAAQGLGVPVTDVTVIHNGIQTQQFGPSFWLMNEGTPSEYIIACTAKLHPMKGLDTLVAAVARLKHLPIALWLIGDGNSQESLAQLAAASGIAERVKFWGMRDDVPDLLRQAHLYVHPARSEAFGNAVLEALASGLPTIVSDNTGAREVFPTVPGVGCVVPTDDVESLAQAIAAWLDDPAECHRQARLSIECASEFNIRAVALKYLKVYEETIQN